MKVKSSAKSQTTNGMQKACVRETFCVKIIRSDKIAQDNYKPVHSTVTRIEAPTVITHQLK